MAGSVGPYGAMLHDGSEYTGIYPPNVTHELLREWHRPRLDALLEAGADLLAFETIPCSMEALALISLLKEYPQARAWLSFSVRVLCCSFFYFYLLEMVLRHSIHIVGN